MKTAPIGSALANAIFALHALRRARLEQRRGPGPSRPWWRTSGKYTGADIRRMARVNGVGRPPVRA